jgi:acetyl esterase
MPLDPQVQAMRDARLGAARVPLYERSLEEARRVDLAEIQASSRDPEPVAEVSERTIPGPGGPLRVRVYSPGGPGPRPLLLYFFGGGWVLGAIDTADGICRSLTNRAGCITAVVGYRLAPEHRFPAAVEDCYACAEWAVKHAAELGASPGRIAVGGDSAGGNLAAAVTLLARARGGPRLAAQLLVYPNTQYGADTPSMRENDDPLFFDRRSVDWYWSHYLEKPEHGCDPLASPLLAEGLAGLPPALVITAEYDPLRDEGERYAEKLRQSGVSVVQTRYDGVIHGFFSMAGTLDAGERALAEAATFLRKQLGQSGA